MVSLGGLAGAFGDNNMQNKSAFDTFLVNFLSGFGEHRAHIYKWRNKNIECKKGVFIGVPENVFIDHGGACTGININHKINKFYKSTSELVASESENTISEWKDGITLHAFNSGILFFSNLVFESASPDTCLSAFLLAARINGVPSNELPASWINYATRWELGDIRSTGETRESWGALCNALTHTFLNLTKNILDEDKNYAIAFNSAVMFIAQLLAQGQLPNKVMRANNISFYSVALAYLDNEQNQYNQLKRNSTILQLRVPVKNSHRFRQVDAILVEDGVSLGTIKNFARTDKDTFFGNGFLFMAVTREQEKGDEGHMVISVDPTQYIELPHLWKRLEAAEDKAWDGMRPRNKPRMMPVSYPLNDGPNQPWWDDHGNYTLLAAPYKVESDGIQGTMLDWKNVCDIIWDVYSPKNGVEFRYINNDGIVKLLNSKSTISWEENFGVPVSIDNVPGALIVNKEIIHVDDIVTIPPKKCVAILAYVSESSDVLTWTPTIRKILAARLIVPDGNKIEIKDLPSDEDFESFDIPGGSVIISNYGVLLIDDWTEKQINGKDMFRDVEHIRKRLLSINKLESRVRFVSEAVSDYTSGTSSKLHGSRLVRELWSIWAEANAVKKATESLGLAPRSIRFRERLEHWWGVKARLDQLMSDCNETERVVTSLTNVRSGSFISALTIYGFPFMLLTNFFSVDALKLPPVPNFDNFTHLSNWGVNWWQITVYLLASSFLSGGLLVATSIIGRISKFSGIKRNKVKLNQIARTWSELHNSGRS